MTEKEADKKLAEMFYHPIDDYNIFLDWFIFGLSMLLFVLGGWK